MILSPTSAFGFLQDRVVEWGAVPRNGSNDAMKLFVAGIAAARGHRLCALPVTRTDQSGSGRADRAGDEPGATGLPEKGAPMSQIGLPMLTKSMLELACHDKADQA